MASATAMVTAESIAVGIFLTPGGMAKSLGSPFWLLMVWIVMGTLAICGALTFGELAARFPRNGGIYVYLAQTCGRSIAFLYGWMCLLVLDPGLTAALALGMASYAGYMIPASALATKALAIGVIWALTVLNMLTLTVSAGVLRWTTWLKFGLLALLVAWAFAFRLGSWSNFVPFVEQRPGSLPLMSALAAGFVGAFFSFGGWWDVSKIGGEIREPGRNLPRAMLLGVVIVTLAYVLVSAAFMYLVPLGRVSSDEVFVAQAGAVLFGAAGGKLFAGVVVICVLTSLAALIMSAPRVYQAMAQDGVFLQAVARNHPRFGTPAAAILIQATLASAAVVVGSFQQIIAYFIFAAVVFLALTAAGLVIFRLRHRQTGPPEFTVPAYPIPVVIYLVLMSVLLLLLGLHQPREAALGTAVVLTGLPAYWAFRKKRVPGTALNVFSKDKVLRGSER